jgi:hypothetical protein
MAGITTCTEISSLISNNGFQKRDFMFFSKVNVYSKTCLSKFETSLKKSRVNFLINLSNLTQNVESLWVRYLSQNTYGFLQPVIINDGTESTDCRQKNP